VEDILKLVALPAAQFAAVVALFLPGFVSLKVDRLIQPATPASVGEMVIEAFAYSLINAGLLSWAVFRASAELTKTPPDYAHAAGFAALVCVVGPVVWPILFRILQRWGAGKGWVLGQDRFAFDFAFRGPRSRWVIVHLNDGRLVGGYFGLKSYATVEPESGHLYVEELWRLDASGRFVTAIPGSRGAIFRPSDYIWIEMFHDGAQPESETGI
jgi:hypothetical protein